MWLVLKEPDLGTSLVFLPVLFAMLFAAGARRRHLVALAMIGIMALPALWSQMSRDQRSRVTALWEQNQPEQSPTPAGYHLHQAKRMFALGGFWGSIFDDDAAEEAVERRVPEAHTDSIFSVLGERYGIAGCGVVLLLYGLLIWRGLAIAQETGEPFGRLVVVGIMAMIAFQVVINTGMLVGLLPITGLPLPLVSYGGSGLIANAMALGLVINVGSRPGYEMAMQVVAGLPTVPPRVRRPDAMQPTASWETFGRGCGTVMRPATTATTFPTCARFHGGSCTSSKEISPVAPKRPMWTIASRVVSGTLNCCLASRHSKSAGQLLIRSIPKMARFSLKYVTVIAGKLSDRRPFA